MFWKHYLSGDMPSCLLSSPHSSLEYCLIWSQLIFSLLWKEQSAHGSSFPPIIMIWSAWTCTAMNCQMKKVTKIMLGDNYAHHRIIDLYYWFCHTWSGLPMALVSSSLSSDSRDSGRLFLAKLVLTTKIGMISSCSVFWFLQNRTDWGSEAAWR